MIEQKMRGDNCGWLLAGDPHGETLIVLKPHSEIILAVPSACPLVSAKLMDYAIDTDRVQEVDYLFGGQPVQGFLDNTSTGVLGHHYLHPRSVCGAAGTAREYLGRRIKPALIFLRKKLARHTN